MSRRVVVTGFGAVTSLGNTSKKIFSSLINSKSGISRIESFDTSDMIVKIAGEMKFQKENHPKSDDTFNPSDYVPKKELKKMDAFIIYALAATEEALSMAGWFPKEEEELLRTGVSVGSGIGGLRLIEKGVIKMHTKGPDHISPFFIPSALINLPVGHISIKYGFLGPNHASVTACATGAHAIYTGAQMIKTEDADIVICGGAENAICKVGIAGFTAARALSTSFNDDPTKASRPWDKDRDGFVMGEGAGILVLEEYEHAKKRGANILAEYKACGLSSDAYHITAPEPNGRGAKNAMKTALAKAGVNPEQIDYINAHGTSTPLGDEAEMNAVQEIFYKGDKITMSSTKGATGHLLGAAGSLEAIICIMAMNEGIIPPTLNLESPIEGSEKFFDLVPFVSREKTLNYVMSNSFGFGGTNTSLIFQKI